jgi:hypothetical protein
MAARAVRAVASSVPAIANATVAAMPTQASPATPNRAIHESSTFHIPFGPLPCNTERPSSIQRENSIHPIVAVPVAPMQVIASVIADAYSVASRYSGAWPG